MKPEWSSTYISYRRVAQNLLAGRTISPHEPLAHRFRSRWLKFLVLTIHSILLGGCWSQVERPNVVLISIDCLNQRQFQSAIRRRHAPSLAMLKNDSIAFSRAYAHAPWTTPSHMSMLTGLYPSQHGRDIPYLFMINTNDFYDRVPSFATIAEHLSNVGYETAAFVGHGSISGVYGLSQGFKLFREHRKGAGRSDLTEAYDSLIDWISNRPATPFFLFLHTYDLHAARPRGLVSDEDVLRYIDQFLRGFFRELKARGIYERSLIIVTGDHGSNMIETEGKCSFHGAGHYEENIKVPFLLKLPSSSRTGEESVLIRHIDILPTVLDVVGLSGSRYDGPGQSILERLRQGESANADVFSFSEADARCARRRALVTDRYKYIYTPRDHVQKLFQDSDRFFDGTCTAACLDLPTEELYDLKHDRFEKENLLFGDLSAEEADWLERLRMEMARHINLPRRYQTKVMPGPNRLLDERETEQLRDSLRTLGYIN